METKQKTLAELISKFENGKESFHKSALFSQVINSLFHGADPLSIINNLITANEDQQKAFENYIKTDVRPMGLILTKEAAELYASEENRKKDERVNAVDPVEFLRYVTEETNFKPTGSVNEFKALHMSD